MDYSDCDVRRPVAWMWKHFGDVSMTRSLIRHCRVAAASVSLVCNRLLIATGCFPVLLATWVVLSWLGAEVNATSTLKTASGGGEHDDQMTLKYPFFLSEPETTAVRSAADVVLLCSAGPSPGVEISWRYNNRSIAVQHRITGLSVRGGHLSIRSFTSHQHAGIYHCVANNSVGAVLSQPAKLVEAVLDGFENDSSSTVVSVVEGNTVWIPCPLPRSTPPALIEMWLNGSRMEMTARHTVLPSRGLLIVDVRRPADQGLYTCVAINSLSQQRLHASSSTNLIINQAPAHNISARFLSMTSTDIGVVRGETLTLECSADGWPVPSVRWSRYGGHLPKDRYSQTSGILTIQYVDSLDEGTYVCEASNDIERSQKKAVRVRVLVPSLVVAPPRNRTAAVGATVSLNCGVQGVPRPYVTWLHNALPIVTESFTSEEFKDNLLDAKLTLVNIDQQQSGVYQCVANNSHGTSYGTSLLTVSDSLQNIALPASRVERPMRQSTIGPRTMRQPSERPRTSRQKSGTEVDGGLNQRNDDRNTNGRMQRNKSRGNGLANVTEALQDEPSKAPQQSQRQTEQMNLVPPPKPSVTVMSETSVMLRWVITPRDVLFVKVQYKRLRNGRSSSGWETVDEDLQATTQSFEVTKLQSGGTYCFRLVAVYKNNDNKHGPNSSRVHLRSTGRRAKAPITGPFVVEVRPLSPRSISITWQYLPIESVTIDGFIVQYRRYEQESNEYIEHKIRNVKTRQTLLNNLDEDATYSIRMQCYNEHGRSNNGNTVVKKTPGVLVVQHHNVSNSVNSRNEHEAGGSQLISASEGSVNGAEQKPAIVFSSTSKKPLLEAAGASPPRVAARQENSTLYIILGVVCGAIIVGVIIVLFVCFRRQKQQRLLIAALRLRSKQPLPIKASSCKPNSMTPMLRQSDNLVSPFPGVGVAYGPDGKTTSSVFRSSDSWSRQYMHDPPVYDYPSHLTDHRLSSLTYSQSHRSIKLGVQHREQKQPLVHMMPEVNLFARNMRYESSTVDELSQTSSTSPTSEHSDSLPSHRHRSPRSPRASHEYNKSEFLTFRGRSVESETGASYDGGRGIAVGRIDVGEDQFVDDVSSLQQPVLIDHYEIIGYHVTATEEELEVEHSCNSSDSQCAQTLQCIQELTDDLSAPESTV